MAGFEFRYRPNGEQPTVRSFQTREAGSLTAGDIVNVASARVALGLVGDRELVGSVQPTKQQPGGARRIDVITDADAVYGVSDPHARGEGDELRLTGVTGDQSVAANGEGELVVVVKCTAEEETLVRIGHGSHFEVAEMSRGARTQLTPEAEDRLISAADAGDARATARLVEAYLPSIAGVAQVYRGVASVNREELMQEGVVGLLRGLRRFDRGRGTPLWAYASWWVREAMQQLVAEMTGPIVLSDRAQRRLARIKEARREHLRTNHEEASPEQLAAATGLTAEQLDSLLSVELTPRGMEEPLRDEEGSGTTFGEQVADPVSEREYDAVLQRLEHEQIRELSRGLEQREREVLYDHYGLDRPHRTLQEIGDGLGLSAERVRQIEQGALEKLRASLT